MTLRRFVSVAVAAAPGFYAGFAAAQVTITFSPVSGVPISPWTAALAALGVVALATGLLRSKGRGRIAMTVVAAAAGSLALQIEDGRAALLAIPLTISPTQITTGQSAYVADFTNPACGPVYFAEVANGTSAPIAISGIAYDAADGYGAYDPNNPPPYPTNPAGPFSGPNGVPICQIGSTLNPAGTCVVWYDRLSMAC